MSRPLLEEMPPLGGGFDRTLALHQWQPMRPTDHWLRNLLLRLCHHWGGNPAEAADNRLPPLEQRWHCHILMAGQAVVADAQGFHDDHARLFMSVSFCFSAMQGTPRLHLGLARHSAASELWEVQMVECRIPPHPAAPWADIATTATTFLASGRDLSMSLCGATRLGLLQLDGSECRLGRCELATTAALAAVDKELFGGPRPGSTAGSRAPAPEVAARRALEWLMVACCPEPFAQDLRMLDAASEQLRDVLERRREGGA